MKLPADGYLRRFWLGSVNALLGLLLAGHTWTGRAAATPVNAGPGLLTNLMAVRLLTVEQAQVRPPVEVTGVVTWLDVGAKGCFLDDGHTAIWVDSALREGLPRGLQLGSRLRATGYAYPGFFTPAITMTNAVQLGTAALPEARPAKAMEQRLGRWDGLRVSLEGTLFRTRDNGGLPELRVLSDGVAVALTGPEGGQPAISDPPRRVAVTGISSLAVRERQPIDCSLLLHSWDQIRFLPQDTNPPAPVPIGGLISATNAPWLDRLVRLSGVVTWRGFGRCVVQDGSGGIMVLVTNGPSPTLHTEVQIVGGVRRSPERTEFIATTVTTGPKAGLPAPQKLTDKDDLLSPAFNGQRVALEGRLVHRQWSANTEEWLMVRPDQPEHFRAVLPHDLPPGSVAGFEVDSTLEITGVLQRDSAVDGRVSDAHVLVAEGGDVKLVNAPPLSRGWSLALVLTTGVTLLVSITGAAWWWHSHRLGRLRQAQLETENRLKTRFALIAETASDQIVTLSCEGRITSINPAGQRLLADAGESPVGQEYQRWIAPRSRPTWQAAVAQAADGREVPPFELVLERTNGTRLEVEIQLRRLNDTELQCIGRDLTERRRAAELAEQNEHWQRLHIEQTPMGVVRFDEAGIIRAWNPAAERIFGWRPAEIIGSSWEVLVPPEQRTDVGRDVFRRVQTHPTVVRNVNLNLTNRGTIIECEWFNNPLLDRDGRFIGVTALVSDVTATRRVQRELADREQQLRTIVESMAEGIIVIDRRRVVVSLNPAAEHILGVPRPELQGRPLAPDWQCLLPDGVKLQPEQHPLNRTLLTGEPVDDCQFSFVAGDGPRRWISVNSRVLFRGPDGAVEHVIATFTDITARRTAEQQRQQLEEQLRHSEKLRALGTLAGGVAHDFNNLLACMLGNAELIQLELPPGHPATENAREIFLVAQRGADLVRRILSFSRPQPASRVNLKLSAVVDDSIRVVSKALPPGVRLHCHFEAGEPALCADPTQLSQVVINLCTNAAHAMEEQGGELEVRVEATAVATEFAAANPPLKPGPAVRLTVRDTGSGMDPATLARVFEPFFTTKGPGRGTGLGLAIVHNIVQAHGGRVFMKSVVGQGTCIDVVLPVEAGSEPAPGKGGPTAELSRSQGEELLVVDDDTSVLRFVERALLGLGYRVTAVASPLAALMHLQREPERFRLLLTDLTMPEQSGVDLALTVRALLPNLPIIIATGYGQTAFEQLARAANQFPILSKPFQLPELASLLRDQLGRPALDVSR